MRIWAVANQKGGVGKTTTAVTLGGLLAGQGKEVLMVDLDPHGSLTTYFGYDPDSLEKSVYTLFERGQVDPAALVRSTRFERLHLLPASTALATLDRQLGAREGMGLVLARALVKLARGYDQVLIDCPPVLGVLMINALAASSYLLVPVQTEFLALKGLERMLHTLEMITKARKRPLPYLIVPTMFDRHTQASLDSMKMLREQHSEVLWNGAIPEDTQFREASQRGEPISLLNPQARGTAAYSALLQHLLAERGSEIPKAGVA